MERLLNTELDLLKENYEGNLHLNGRFLNYQKVLAPGFRDLLRWRFSKNPERDLRNTKPWHAPLLSISKNNLNKNIEQIIWLGHASFLININGKKIVTDPVFGDIPFVKRLVGMPCSINDLIDIDYILISHSHYDHIDKSSLQKLTKQNPQAIIYCGLNHKDLFAKFGIQNQVIESGWYQKYPLKELDIYFMPALHWSRRNLFDRNRRLWGSFVIRSGLKSIYFMGDSGYSSHFKEITNIVGPIDYCLMGIGAYKPSYIMQSSHTSPEEAVVAFHDLKGKIFIPMHYGTYTLADEPLKEPLDIIHELNLNKQINGQLKAPAIGEIIELR